MTYMLRDREMVIRTLEISAELFNQIPTKPRIDDLELHDVRLKIPEPVTTRPGNELLIPLMITGQFEGRAFDALIEGHPRLSNLKFDLESSSMFFSSIDNQLPLTDRYFFEGVVLIASADYEPAEMLLGDANNDGTVS